MHDLGEIKAVTGVSRVARWLAPAPINTAPTMVVVHPTLGDLAPAMTAVRASTTVSAVSPADRRTITHGNIGATSRGIVGRRWGIAYLKLQEGAAPIQVVIASFLTATTCLLADPLPHGVTVGAGATLEIPVYYFTLAAADATSVAARNIEYRVSYSTKDGADAPDEPLVDNGIIHVVRKIFSTGVDDEQVKAVAASFGRTLPGRQDSFAPQIALALDELIGWIRVAIRDAGRTGIYEDDLPGRQLANVHAILTAGYVLAGQTAGGAGKAEARDWFTAKAKALFGNEIQQIWADLDADGVADSGEELEMGGVPAVAGGSFTDADISTLESAGWERRAVTDER